MLSNDIDSFKLPKDETGEQVNSSDSPIISLFFLRHRNKSIIGTSSEDRFIMATITGKLPRL